MNYYVGTLSVVRSHLRFSITYDALPAIRFGLGKHSIFSKDPVYVAKVGGTHRKASSRPANRALSGLDRGRDALQPSNCSRQILGHFPLSSNVPSQT